MEVAQVRVGEVIVAVGVGVGAKVGAKVEAEAESGAGAGAGAKVEAEAEAKVEALVVAKINTAVVKDHQMPGEGVVIELIRNKVVKVASKRLVKEDSRVDHHPYLDLVRHHDRHHDRHQVAANQIVRYGVSAHKVPSDKNELLHKNRFKVETLWRVIK